MLVNKRLERSDAFSTSHQSLRSDGPLCAEAVGPLSRIGGMRSKRQCVWKVSRGVILFGHILCSVFEMTDIYGVVFFFSFPFKCPIGFLPPWL